MKIRVIAVGRPKLGYAKDGLTEYLTRLERMGRFELDFVRAGDRNLESAALLDRSRGELRVALDERGALLTTRHLADRFRSWQNSSARTVTFLIGGSDGHTPELRKQADLTLALSPLTLQHELALLVLLEQLYRVQSILAGSPYHRE